MNSGWWTIGRLRGAPIRLHWSLPLGAFVWGGFRIAPAFWLAFATLILVHELGHALLVVRYRLGLSEIAVHGAGGYCRHQRSGTRFEEAAVAWGGVLAQLALFVLVALALRLLGPPSSRPAAQLVHVFTETNLFLVAINLIPVEPLDGRKAWPLLGMLVARLRDKVPTRGARAPDRRRGVQGELRAVERVDTQPETPSQRTDRLVRELIERTTQRKDR